MFSGYWYEYLREAFAQSYSTKQLFLKITPNSQENTRAGISVLIKFQDVGKYLLKHLFCRKLPSDYF